ncbi:small membrane protein YdgU [Hafnia psychrotolerans]
MLHRYRFEITLSGLILCGFITITFYL